jgi:hypothetical protein
MVAANLLLFQFMDIQSYQTLHFNLHFQRNCNFYQVYDERLICKLLCVLWLYWVQIKLLNIECIKNLEFNWSYAAHNQEYYHAFTNLWMDFNSLHYLILEKQDHWRIDIRILEWKKTFEHQIRKIRGRDFPKILEFTIKKSDCSQIRPLLL